jgi:GDP-L-fucose synthase
MLKTKIYIAGHNGMVGSAITRLLKKKNGQIITKNKNELNLINQLEVEKFFASEKPDQVYIASAKVGGIYANHTYPAEFIYENIMIQANIINSAFLHGTKKIINIGSSCIYPKFAKQPIIEEELLNGSLENTNEPYAIAKIAGIKMCESYNRQYKKKYRLDYRSVMPTNLYGPNDNYDLKNSHVIPALIRKFHDAKIKKKKHVIVWGTGKVKREFLHVDDLVNACYLIMNLKKKSYDKITDKKISHINVGFGSDLPIKKLATTIKKIVGYEGSIIFDKSKPDGTPRKLLNSKRIFSLGWRPKISLLNGLESTYADYIKNIN